MVGSSRMCVRCGKTRLRASNPEDVCGACARAAIENADTLDLPNDFWFQPRIVAACGRWDIGTILRSLLDATDLTEQRLGELIDRSQAQVWRIANHRSECHDIRVIKAISDVLGCPPILLGLAPIGAELAVTVNTADPAVAEEDPTDRREFIIWGASGLVSRSGVEHPLTSPDVQRLHGIVRDLLDQDDQRGGGIIADVAHRYFRRALQALSKGQYANQRVRRELEAVTSELGEATGWFAFDSERNVLARSCYTEALCIADMSGDEIQAVHILASMSLQSTYRNQPHEAVQLAQYASRRALPWAPPRLLSMLNIREARGWARKGDEAEFRKAIIRAKKYFDQGKHEDDPPWLTRYYDYAQILNDEAFGWADLERHKRAEDHIRLVLGQRDPHFGRNRALSNARLAEVTLAQNRIQDASHIAVESLLPCLRDVTSTRVLAKARRVRGQLEPHQERHPEARYFVHAFDHLTTSR